MKLKLSEAILNEAKSADAEFKKRKSAVDKELKEIEKKIKGMDARQKKDPENWGYVGSLGKLYRILTTVMEYMNKNYKGWD